MNRGQHEDFVRCTWHLGGGKPGAELDALVEGCGGADTIDDVELSIPVDLAVLTNKSALTHFQRRDGSGYLLISDPSLGPLSTVGEVATQLAGTWVSGRSEPMRAACLIQQGRALADFRFPSLSRMGAHHAKSKDPVQKGRACHMIQDACMWPHVVNQLLGGHQELEDEQEDFWDDHRRRLKASGSDKVLCDAVRAELAGITAPTVEDLINANVSWTLQRFGEHRRLEDWTDTDYLATCIRAVASTMRGLQLMKGEA